MTLKEFVDKCIGDYHRVYITEVSDDLRIERCILDHCRLYHVTEMPKLHNRKILHFNILMTPKGLEWYIELEKENQNENH